MPKPKGSLVGVDGKALVGRCLDDRTDPLGTVFELHMAKRCSQTLVDRTLREWQGYYATPLTEEDARDITNNLLEFFDVLLEWDNHRDFPNN
jgi:hypothetical protein